jgi:hypothetical protein
MRRVCKAAALTLFLAGCGTSGPGAPSGPGEPGLAAPSLGPPPIAVFPAPISVPPPLSVPPDQCGAWELQGLVGQHRTAIPVPVQVTRRRVICTTCPRTREFIATRMTIEYDPGTERVTSVACN